MRRLISVLISTLIASCASAPALAQFQIGSGSGGALHVVGASLPACDSSIKYDYILTDPTSATDISGGAVSLYDNAHYLVCDRNDSVWRILATTFPDPPSGVASVFGRTGTVFAQVGDYSVSQITGAAASSTLSGTGASQGASLIGVRDVANNFTGTTVEAALAELAILVASHNGTTNLSTTTTSTSATVVSDTGTDATLPASTTSQAGLMTAADRTKLNGIATGATDGLGSDPIACPAGQVVNDQTQSGSLICVADDDIPDAGEVSDTALAAGAVDGGTAGEIQDDTITAADLAADSVGSSEIATDAVGSSEIAANSVGNSEMADAAIGIAELSATGTASSTTFLRGDNTWATPTGGGGGGLAAVVDDLSPVLGGDLNAAGRDINNPDRIGAAVYYASTQSEYSAALTRCGANYGGTASTGCTIQLACGTITWDNAFVGAADSGAQSHSGVTIRGCGGGGATASGGGPADTGGSTVLNATTATPMLSIGSCDACRVEDLIIDGNDIATIGIDFADTGGGFPTTHPVISNVRIHHINGPAIRTGFNATALSSLTRFGTTATATTSSPHLLGSNDDVTISNASDAAYNGTKRITVTSSTTFTFTVSGSAATPATGASYYSRFAPVTQVDRLEVRNTQMDSNDTCYQQMHSQTVGTHFHNVSCNVPNDTGAIDGLDIQAGDFALTTGYFGSKPGTTGQIFLNRGAGASTLLVSKTHTEWHGTTGGYFVKDDDTSAFDSGTLRATAHFDSNDIVYDGAMNCFSVKREGAYQVSNNLFNNQGANGTTCASTFASDADSFTQDRLLLQEWGNVETASIGTIYPQTWKPTIGSDVDLGEVVIARTTAPADCRNGQLWIDTDGTSGQRISTCEGGSWVAQAGGGGGSTLPVVDTTGIAKGSVDATKIVRFEVDGIPTATTRVVTPASGADSVTVVPDAGAANNFLTGITTAGAITKAQPTFGNISGTAADAQIDGSLESDEVTGLSDAQISNTLTASNLVGAGSTTNAVDLATAEVSGQIADANVSDTLTASSFVGSGSTTTAVDIGTAEVAGTLGVGKGGTGAGSFTSNSILTGNGTSAIQSSAGTIVSGALDGITTADFDGAATGPSFEADAAATPLLTLDDTVATDSNPESRVNGDATADDNGRIRLEVEENADGTYYSALDVQSTAGAVTVALGGNGGANYIKVAEGGILTGEGTATIEADALTGTIPPAVNLVVTDERVLAAGVCDAGTTGRSLWSTPASSGAAVSCRAGTNVVRSTLDFADGSDLSAQTSITLPAALTGNIDAVVYWSSGSTSTNPVVWQIAIACVANGESDDPTFTDDLFTADANLATANQINTTSTNTVTTTGSCAAGEVAFVRIRRDSADAGDTLASTARMHSVQLFVQRTL